MGPYQAVLDVDVDNESADSGEAGDEKSPPVKMCSIAFVLVYGLVIGIVQNGLIAIAVPRDISFYLPNHAALANGLLIGAGCVTHLLGPIIGDLSDKFGRRRVIHVGAGIVTAGVCGLAVAVYIRSLTGFVFYCLSYLVTQTGYVVVLTGFQTLVADFGAAIPSKLGAISGLWGLYQLLGSLLSYVIAGVVFPVTDKAHGFYLFMLGLVLCSNIALARIPTRLTSLRTAIGSADALQFSSRGSLNNPVAGADRKELGEEQERLGGEAAEEQDLDGVGLASCGGAVTTWWQHDRYYGFRAVILARFLYFYFVGVFGAYALYFLQDCTDATNATAAYTLIAVFSMAGSLLAVWPAGKLSDYSGPLSCSVFGSLLIGILMSVISFFDKILIFLIIIPVYGIAQQFYNVGDLALVCAALPFGKQSSRDIGLWGVVQNLGQAIGAAISGVTLTYVGKTGDTTHANDADRAKYSRSGYTAIFLPAAGICVLSAAVLCSRRKALTFK